MSRSRKKVSCFSDYSRRYTKYAKRQASKVVRRYPLWIPDGAAYKRLYCSYNICDYKFLYFSPEDCYKPEIYEQGKRK